MRSDSATRGLYRPTFEELEKIYNKLKGFKCPGCKVKMVWTQQECTRRVITIQHDRSGKIQLVCKTCNAFHKAYPGDSFFTTSNFRTFCRKCHEQKGEADFYKNRTSNTGFTNWCIKCLREYYAFK